MEGEDGGGEEGEDGGVEGGRGGRSGRRERGGGVEDCEHYDMRSINLRTLAPLSVLAELKGQSTGEVVGDTVQAVDVVWRCTNYLRTVGDDGASCVCVCMCVVCDGVCD